MNLDNKTVVLTGASGGIGLALVEALLQAGTGKLIAADIQTSGLDHLTTSEPGKIIAKSLDVTDETAVHDLARQFPDADVVINCHGVVVHESVLEASETAAFRREMEVNYWGQVHMCRAFAPGLKTRNAGAIVNFLSPLAFITFPFLAPYCASKAACRVLTEALRAEFAQSDVLVMAAFPGSIETPMMRNVAVAKSSPGEVAQAIVDGLVNNHEEVWAGEGAEEMRLMLEQDPAAIRAVAATRLRLSDVNEAGGAVSA